jgi:hypothetical protein
MSREIVVEYPAPPAHPRPLARVRSTIVTSALTALRERGHFERYLGAIDAKSREILLTTIAGTWLPVDLVMRHYMACESLGLPYDECFAMGNAVGARMHESVLHLVRGLASGAGVTVWTAAARYESFWTRLFDGGGFRIVKAGPKDGVMELFQLPIAQFAYFRAAFCGVSQVGISFFTTKAYVRVIGTTKDGFSVRSSWV